MLPRWLTALPRFAATWRDEILVVTVGLVYTAGLGAPHAARHGAGHDGDEVVVRIAAPAPMTVTTSVDVHTDVHTDVQANVQANVQTNVNVARLAATTIDGRRLRVERVAPIAAEHHALRLAPQPALAPLPRATPAPASVTVASAPGARAFVVDGLASLPRRAHVILPSDAGENIAAELSAGIEIDTVVLPEIRASVERARAAMDEARVRAALQKALAAERSLPRFWNGPGA